MKILLLSPNTSLILPILERFNDQVITTTEKLSIEFLSAERFDIGVSFGYRHILKTEHLAICPVINLHISYLPWNRGADPNLWSWIDDTPKGVTIHRIDQGIDTGDILAQRLVNMSEQETLATSYAKLIDVMVELFEESWPLIRLGKLAAQKQVGSGSIHFLKDGKAILDSLKLGYDTPVIQLKDIK